MSDDKKNAPPEIDLLRKVAAAAKWSIEANGDYVVGKDGRQRVSIRTVMADGTLNKALQELECYYDIPDLFAEKRQEALDMQDGLDPRWKKKREREAAKAPD